MYANDVAGVRRRCFRTYGMSRGSTRLWWAAPSSALDCPVSERNGTKRVGSDNVSNTILMRLTATRPRGEASSTTTLSLTQLSLAAR
jgi:hypothetical protein